MIIALLTTAAAVPDAPAAPVLNGAASTTRSLTFGYANPTLDHNAQITGFVLKLTNVDTGLEEADLQEAIKWYRQSVEKGDGYAPALYNLGLMQAYGRGLNQDFSRALLLFQVKSSLVHSHVKSDSL